MLRTAELATLQFSSLCWSSSTYLNSVQWTHVCGSNVEHNAPWKWLVWISTKFNEFNGPTPSSDQESRLGWSLDDMHRLRIYRLKKFADLSLKMKVMICLSNGSLWVELVAVYRTGQKPKNLRILRLWRFHCHCHLANRQKFWSGSRSELSEVEIIQVFSRDLSLLETLLFATIVAGHS